MFDYLKGFFRNYFYEEEQFAALFLLIITGILLYFIGSTITPIFVSILIAYLLNGVMNFFERKKQELESILEILKHSLLLKTLY